MSAIARWLNVLLGGWLAVAPRVLASGDANARSVDFGLGVAVAAVGFAAMGTPQLRHLNTALGLLVVVAPFLFGFHSRALAVNDVVVGCLVVLLSLVRGRTPRRLHPARPVVP